MLAHRGEIAIKGELVSRLRGRHHLRPTTPDADNAVVGKQNYLQRQVLARHLSFSNQGPKFPLILRERSVKNSKKQRQPHDSAADRGERLMSGSKRGNPCSGVRGGQQALTAKRCISPLVGSGNMPWIKSYRRYFPCEAREPTSLPPLLFYAL